MSKKKQFSVRLRAEQERKIQLMVDLDPELTPRSIRKAIDEYLSSRVREEPPRYRTKKTKPTK
jgi:hypothetical protein